MREAIVIAEPARSFDVPRAADFMGAPIPSPMTAPAALLKEKK